MNANKQDTISRPCAAWANALASNPDDLSAAECAALDAHVATCDACAAARADYAQMDALIRGLPAPAPLTRLPAELTALWRKEDAQDSAHETDEGGIAIAPVRTLPLRPQRRLPARSAAFGAFAAVLIIGVVVAGFAALLGHRQSGPGATTGFNGNFGPTVLPSGPQPQASKWLRVVFPAEIPDLAALYDTYNGGTGFTLTNQSSVAGLLYACWTSPTLGGTALLWRSENAGDTWTRLDRPGDGGCFVSVSADAPDTVFLNASSSSPGYYSLDRGAHWTPLTPPAGYETWNAPAPSAQGDTWYYSITPLQGQPVLWVSQDHGAHWRMNHYPVTFPARRADGTLPGVGPILSSLYDKGGLLLPFAHTLWWSPDYGATWQRLGAWGDPPCDGEILNTPDLSVMYCVLWNGELRGRPYWRSLDRGLTWQPVPDGPPAAITDASPAAAHYVFAPIMLRDGALLRVAVTPDDPTTIALYSLAPNANVWAQASGPLNSLAPLCPQSNHPGSVSICETGLEIGVTDGPNGNQYLYLTHTTHTELLVTQLVWS